MSEHTAESDAGAADLFGGDGSRRAAMGSHQSASGGTDEWLTPPDLIAALGPFDLDPCSPIARPWDTAIEHRTIEDDGLRYGGRDWSGRVWLNPPYSHAGKWLAALAEHGQGTALIFARTETRMWFDHVWPKASGVLFIKGRLHFHYANGKRAAANSGAPSALVAYGEADAAVLATGAWPGHYVDLERRTEWAVFPAHRRRPRQPSIEDIKEVLRKWDARGGAR